MKLSIDIRTLSSKPSGIGLYVYYFIKELLKYDDIDMILFTDIIDSQEIKELKNNFGIQIIEFGKPVKRNIGIFSYFKFIKTKLQDIQPDIFWEPNQIIPIRLNCKGCKTIITMHDILPLSHKKYHKWNYVPYFYFFLTKTLKNVDGIIYNSENTKLNVSRAFKVKENITEHISYCIVKENIRLNTEDKNYFLYIGNLEKKKGVDILLDSYEMYLKRGGVKKLIIAGNLREKDLGLKIDEIKKLYPGYIEYLGYITQDKKEDLLENCSCFVFPSRAEGFGIPPIEAMHYYKPIIASDLEIFKEIMGNSINYFKLSNDSSDVKKLTLLLERYGDDTSSYETVVRKYSGENRTHYLYKYFKSIVDKRE